VKFDGSGNFGFAGEEAGQYGGIYEDWEEM
jgi:hypothetical protein